MGLVSAQFLMLDTSARADIVHQHQTVTPSEEPPGSCGSQIPSSPLPSYHYFQPGLGALIPWPQGLSLVSEGFME